MGFLAEHEVDDLQDRFDPEECPNLHAGVRALERLKDWTNGCSDGWAYWQPPQKAATPLMDRLKKAEADQRGLREPVEDIGEAELRKLLKPVRSFLLGRNADPKLLDPPPPVPDVVVISGTIVVGGKESQFRIDADGESLYTQWGAGIPVLGERVVLLARIAEVFRDWAQEEGLNVD